ncbi:MAG: molybdopterin-dependent oxidoreductase [Candidatus Heimdallarchaeota archaeon]|nr:MAG: molybdopterin-dependent oxidoreductase [Candidatus Heimdallarchaeota archaeon]
MNRVVINSLFLIFLFSLPLIAVGYIVSKQTQITPNDEFFTNSISPPPQINVTTWTLSVFGHVQSPLVFTYENFTTQQSKMEIATIRCVEGYSGTAEWRGIRVREILDLAQVKDGAVDVIFRAWDGYSSSLTIEEATKSDVLLAFEMNGETLPVNQGFPVRVVAPGHAGYKWVMWVYEIKIVDYNYRGFWETRGWSDDASYTSLKDWVLHATLFSITFLLGGFSIVSGLRRVGKMDSVDLPDFIESRKVHFFLTAAYLIAAMGTFVYWIIQTFSLKGTVFYSLHGIIALLSMIGLIGTGITGLLKVKGMTKQKSWHLNLSVFAFSFYTVTVVIGITLGLGVRFFA